MSPSHTYVTEWNPHSKQPLRPQSNRTQTNPYKHVSRHVDVWCIHEKTDYVFITCQIPASVLNLAKRMPIEHLVMAPMTAT